MWTANQSLVRWIVTQTICLLLAPGTSHHSPLCGGSISILTWNITKPFRYNPITAVYIQRFKKKKKSPHFQQASAEGQRSSIMIHLRLPEEHQYSLQHASRVLSPSEKENMEKSVFLFHTRTATPLTPTAVSVFCRNALVKALNNYSRKKWRAEPWLCNTSTVDEHSSRISFYGLPGNSFLLPTLEKKNRQIDIQIVN